MRVYTFLMALVLPVSAAAVDTLQYGLMPSVISASVYDPEGNSKTTTVVNIFNVALVHDLQRDGRMFYQLYYESYNIDADVDAVGQSVQRLGAMFSYQSLFRITRGWKPWAGIGLSLSEDKYSKRHIVDDDGFLKKQFPVRERTSYGVILNTTTEWAVSQDWTIGFHINYEQPFGDSTRALTLACVLLW